MSCRVVSKFYFSLCKYEQYNSKAVMPSLLLRYAFALPSLQVRFKSVPNPIQVRSQEWDLHGICKGGRRELQGTSKNVWKTRMKPSWKFGKNNDLQMWLYIFFVFKVFFALFLVLIIFFRNFAAEKDGSTGFAWPLLILFQGCILVHQLLIFKQTNYGRLSRDKH